MKTTKSVALRVITAILVIANTAVGYLNDAPFSDSAWYKIVSLILLAITIGIVGWYNNDFTEAAKFGTDVTHAIKDGKLTTDEVSELLKSGTDTMK